MEVFKDYPYSDLLQLLSKGSVDLNPNSFEVGQIYVFVRKKMYSQDEDEDLKIVKDILPQQLETMFSPPFPKTDFRQKLPANYGELSNGVRISPLPRTDTFIMSCYSIRETKLKTGLNPKWSNVSSYVEETKPTNLSYDKYNAKLNKVAYVMEFKYCNLFDLRNALEAYQEQIHIGKTTYSEVLNKMVLLSGEIYSSGIKGILEWAYVFKFPIDAPIAEFMNWKQNPLL